MIHKNETHTKMGPTEKIHKTETHKTQRRSKKWGSQTLSTKMRLSKNINKNETHIKKTKLRLTKMFHKNVNHKIDPQKWDLNKNRGSQKCDSKTWSTKIFHKNNTQKMWLTKI